MAVGLLLAAEVACAGRQPPDNRPQAAAPCDRSEVAVRGAGSGPDGIGRFVASGVDCDASRDTLAVGVLARLLFAGVPESPQTTPMLANPDGERRDESTAVRRLLGREGLQFVVEATPATDGGTLFRINLAGLRTWLERNGLARRFGIP